MAALHDIHFEFQTKSQLYKFTDTSLFVNYKEYPYKDITVKSFHDGGLMTNSYYTLETYVGKKLIVAYKPKKIEIAAQLKPIMDYIASFNEEESKKYHERHKEFEFLVDDADPSNTFVDRIREVVVEYINSDKGFILSDYVFDGEIQLNQELDSDLKIEIYMYDIEGNPVHIGYVPEKLLDEMDSFLEEDSHYELRMLASGYGIGKKKVYIIRALLIFEKDN